MSKTTTSSDTNEDDFLNGLLSGLDRVHHAIPHAPAATTSPRRLKGSHRYKHPTAHPLPQTRSLPPPKTAPPRRTPTLPTRASFSVDPKDVDVAALVEGWDWGNVEVEISSPRKRVRRDQAQEVPGGVVSTADVKPTCTRCVVETVREEQVAGSTHKILTVRVDACDERRTVALCDQWAHADTRPGDVVNVLGEFTPASLSTSASQAITVSAKSNLIIQHPDLLITATALSNAPQCRRKPLLSLLVRSSTDVTPSLIWGNILHEVMQSCMQAKRWDEQWIDGKIDEVVRTHLVELFRIDVGVEEAQREVKSKARGLRVFSERYMGDIPKSTAILTNTRSTDQVSLLAVTQLHDVEEEIWSPTYGLKGKLDATVQATITDAPRPGRPKASARASAPTSSVMPFEIKTGRTLTGAGAGLEHRAQTMLYTLLAAERYGVAVPGGLLYYTQSEEVVRVSAGRSEVVALVGARNEMAGYMMRRSGGLPERKKEGGCVRERDIEDAVREEPFLPATIDDGYTCKKCYSLDVCMLYRKAVENVVDTTSPIADIYESKTGHLTAAHTAFFKEWEALISLEEQDMTRYKKELWTVNARDRESRGRCFSDMVLAPAKRTLGVTHARLREGGSQAPGAFRYRFVRAPGAGGSLLSGHMSCGDAITISVEPNMLSLVRGSIVVLTAEEVVVDVDHEVDEGKIRRRLGDGLVLFRIDRDEVSVGLGRIRENLARLFYVDGDARRRGLVVDLERPEFDDAEATLGRARCVRAYVSATEGFNPNQVEAMTKVLSARDYALILGMPGTGKTTVIAALIRTLVGMGKTVLLTSYTHSAVDTILGKLKGEAFGILRLGNVDKVHADVQGFTLGVASTIAEMEEALMAPAVVATTCLSIEHAVFCRRRFDYCIVDEASQMTLPACLGPLRFADKFVLVGDHFQLPPLVRSGAARKGGLEMSLFRRLCDAHGEAVVELGYQYRMNEDIMLLSNRLIYGDRMRCGTAEVGKREVVLGVKGVMRRVHEEGGACVGECWLERVLDRRTKAVFVDTDGVPGRERRVGELVENGTEARLVCEAVEVLVRSGVREEEVGVISLYRQQVKLVGSMLRERGRCGVEVLTADRSQGRDKDVVVVSMVRSNGEGEVGELMKDWRRVNVAITRGRAKLVVIGSRGTVGTTMMMGELLMLMEGRGWVVRAGRGVHGGLGGKRGGEEKENDGGGVVGGGW